MKGLVGIASVLIRVNDLPPTAVEDSRAGVDITFQRGAYQSSIWAFSPLKYCILHPAAPAQVQEGEKGDPTPAAALRERHHPKITAFLHPDQGTALDEH